MAGYRHRVGLPTASNRSDQTPDKSKLFLRLFLQNERRLRVHDLLPNRADAATLQEASPRCGTSSTRTAHRPTSRPPCVAYYKVLDFYKKSHRARVRLSQMFLDRVAETAAEQSEVLHLDDRRDALTGCVEKLRERDRELLATRFADGATTQSTSEQVGRSVEAVYKALAKLRQILFNCVQKTLAREGRS